MSDLISRFKVALIVVAIVLPVIMFIAGYFLGKHEVRSVMQRYDRVNSMLMDEREHLGNMNELSTVELKEWVADNSELNNRVNKILSELDVQVYGVSNDGVWIVALVLVFVGCVMGVWVVSEISIKREAETTLENFRTVVEHHQALEAEIAERLTQNDRRSLPESTDDS